MGAGIAELMAYQAIPVLLVDIDEERVQQGVQTATKILTKAGKKAEWSPTMLEQRVRCVEGATDYDGFEYVDAVVEAVVESMDIKHQVFSALEKRLPKSAVIASNTSALSISQLQADVQHPERVCGLHFFNPPHRMPLVEIVRGDQTSDETLATAFDLALRLRKTPVIVNDSPGFVVNRILAAYLTEAGHLMQEGMRMRALDRVMTEFGMPMGPARLLDEVGLDVIASASKTMESGLGERFRPAPVMVQIFETGVTGKKGGRGFYVYEDGKRRGVNEDIAAILAEAGRSNAPEPHSAEERMVYAMINEAARTLEDGVVAAPEDIDVAMIMGTGFPPFRGGLLRYADRVGLAKIVLRLRELAREHGPQFEPSSALVERQSFF